ncbi:ras family [Plasmopara halstedii]|uniref:Ras family n=1 Tax=Plasmopara halstedii TaxID=4781 RepID=A0A0P1AN77_PLAHL|nr:ras family [Plasmopara halstedii]CEG42449.1 ras family [Plasmopara halstedii]|eukprot:XP_024578818.1 ras family [Plasmopara halstedii]
MPRRSVNDGNKFTGLCGDKEVSEDSGRPSVLRVKIISMGESGVGKSCVIKRYCEEKFVSKYISTIGIDYGVKPVMVNEIEVRVNFWDLSGLPEYLELRILGQLVARSC